MYYFTFNLIDDGFLFLMAEKFFAIFYIKWWKMPF